MATTTTAAMAVAVAATTPVFEPGKLPVTARGGPDFRMLHGNHHDGRPDELRNTGLVVVAPTEAGTYPVVVFLHGFWQENRQYRQLLTHVASHGFIAVAPQLHRMTLVADNSNDIATAKAVINWLGDEDSGLLHILRVVLGLPGVEPNLSKLALAGHSRGGHAAFAIALGPPDELKLRLSALIGIDPVAGSEAGKPMPPEVLTFEPRSMDLHGVPVLVVGTGLGPEKLVDGRLVEVRACAPAGLNHVEFYDECRPPRYHAVLADYGHMDMTDDGVSNLLSVFQPCRSSGREHPKDVARRAMGGLVVAFLRSKLEGDDHDLKLVLANPGLAPAMLHQVEHDLE